MLFRGDSTPDQLIDVIVGKRMYVHMYHTRREYASSTRSTKSRWRRWTINPTALLSGKRTEPNLWLDKEVTLSHLLNFMHLMISSWKMNLHLFFLLNELWEYLNLIRVYGAEVSTSLCMGCYGHCSSTSLDLSPSLSITFFSTPSASFALAFD